MKNNIKLFFPLIVALALAGGYYMGLQLNKNSLITYGKSSSDLGAKFESILEVIEERYVDTIDRDHFLDKAINDVLHKLDPHSNYIPSSEVARMMESIDGKFGGIGVRFMLHKDSLAITHVIPLSPSEKADILPGDRIIEVDGVELSTISLSNSWVMDHLKGEPGTKVTVKVFRNGKTSKHVITRGIIPLESISCATMITPDVGYIRLEQFSQTSSDEFYSAATILKVKGMKKLIFDLRDNGGGVLGSAIEIIDEFLESGKLIVYTDGANQPERRYTSSSRGILKDIEVAVLINENSASASEIVAGAIQDNDRGMIIGRRSFGKGLVQEDIPLRDGSNIRLTVARYYTPTGRCIQRPYGENVDYTEDFFHRYENGELYAVDSTLFVDSLKYTTPGGRTVYGGGGIMPDIFVPYDSSHSSFYLSELRYGLAFGHFAFDKVNEWGRSKWKNEDIYAKTFSVSDALLNEFLTYAEKELGIDRDITGEEKSKANLRKYLKAEIARQIWVEQGYFRVIMESDPEALKAIEVLH